MGPLMCSSGQGGGCEVVASGSSGVEFLVVWLWLEASHASHLIIVLHACSMAAQVVIVVVLFS